MSDAELRSLLRDCLHLWDIPGKVTAADDGMAVETPDGRFLLQRAAPDMRPAGWLLQTPERAAAGRPPRVAASIVAALGALRNALGAAGGASLRIGAQ
ncbi:MAG TPA: hypothetical protein VME47_22290 [Acetobacteraceae bacterium]|nr:hypothetical protein [Acetobacteraceae bacterium]